MTMTLPYREPLVPLEPGVRQIPEPPRRGEPGGPPCRICEGRVTPVVWSDENWTLHPPRGGSLPGAVWVASRVHLYRWGDGGAHFQVWFIPRPLGMVEASGMMLPLWEDVLPNVSDEELAAAAERVAAAM